MTVTPFRAGTVPGMIYEPDAEIFDAIPAGAHVLLADISEFQPALADSTYLQWSKAIVIRAAYGDAHDDRAWYGGARRADLHKGGARFLGIYQYLVAGQDGAAQANALHDLVGGLQKGEVIVADFEEGQHAMLTAWYNRMLALGYPARCIWTYSGLSFGQANGALPVQWLAAYQSTEPGSPHTLWQFTSSYSVPGVGYADCSVFHGTIDQLAALAYQGSAPPPPPPPPPSGVSWAQWPAGVVLQMGSTDTAAVRVLQTALANSGIYGVRGITVDGVFGEQTRVALGNYQAQAGLLEDWKAGQLTRASLVALGDL
jgi:peptidoglycan hydrolase-like protein with peptidoglycan-binding domain